MSPKPIRTGQSHLLSDTFVDFSNGIVGNVSDVGAPIRHLRRGDNVTFDRRRGLGIRRGYRDVTDYNLPYAIHSLAKFYNVAGSNKAFSAADAFIYSLIEASGYAVQSLPFAVSTNWWHTVNINGVLVMVQEGGTNSPMVYNGTTWLSMVYPTPDSTTISSAVAGGGSVDTGAHNYRVRHLFSNGASQVNGLKLATTTAGNNTVNLSTIPISARSDYIGFQIERTKLSDAVTYYYVGAVINAATTTFTDTSSDLSLGTIIANQPGPYGSAPHFDNIAVYRGRLIGFAGGLVYPGQAVADVQPGVGCFNFNAASAFPASEIDDGDAIQLGVHQIDRLVILKGKSIHALSGYDLDSFVMTPLHFGAGAAGTRAACSVGPSVYFYDGDDRLFVMEGSTVRRLGDAQIGHYLQEVTVSVAAQKQAVLVNYLGNRVLFAYPANPSTYNNEVLALRLADGRWEHYTKMRIVDALVQARRDDFAGASMIFADPLIQSASLTQGFSSNPSFVAWTDSRAGSSQYYVQKLTSAGVVSLAANGVAVSAATLAVTSGVTMASDLSGSAFYVAYGANQSTPSDDLFVQKVDAAGVLQWGAGVNISGGSAAGANAPSMCVDTSGNLIVAWVESVVRVQKLNTAGVVQWTAGGVQLSGSSNSGRQNVVSDGAGGCYVFWYNFNVSQMSVTRLDSTGAPVAGWTLTGRQIGSSLTGSNETLLPGCVSSDPSLGVLTCRWSGAALTAVRITPANVLAATSASLAVATSAGSVTRLGMVSDDSAGAYIAFTDTTTSPRTLKVLRINSSCVAVWANPLVVASEAISGSVDFFRMIRDGAGGVIVVWYEKDGTGGSIYRVHVQKIDKNGSPQWGAGVVASNRTLDMQFPTMVTDGAGGCIVYWQDGLSATSDVYGQRILTNGALSWGTSGVVVCSAAGSQLMGGSINRGESAFTASPSGDIPSNSSAGYHVWSAFDGLSDQRPRTASLAGTPIPWYAELPAHDAGEPDTFKVYEALEVYARTGIAALNVGLKLDAGDKVVAIPVQINVQGPKWGGSGVAVASDTLYWGPADGSHPTQPHTWGGNSSPAIRAGCPAGLTGRKHALSISATTSSDLQVDGMTIDYRRQPDRSF